MVTAPERAIGTALRIGPYPVDPPVVLAPMAGVTNIAFRQLCREHGAGLYVCEMIASRALVERCPETLRMIRFDPEEHPRSAQLSGVDPAIVGAAVRMIADEDLADHVDLNFGCPVPKVTCRGGGAALPFKHRLFERIITAAVTHAGARPVTVKLRIGIDEAHQTHLTAGRIAADAGVAAVSLHGRTAAQRYSGHADWDAIARQRDALPSELPVLGNGDIFSTADALDMLAYTGCDGVMIGRGCLGRPWLFAELEAALTGRPMPAVPCLGAVAATVTRHAHLLTRCLGVDKGIRDLRKHLAWYLKGYPVGSAVRHRLGMVGSLDELAELLAGLDHAALPDHQDAPRGRRGSPGRVSLPDGWLDDPEDVTVPGDAELATSGG